VARPRLPLTSFEREQLRPAYASAAVVSLLGLATAALALVTGNERIALLVLVVTGAYDLGILSVRLRIPWLTTLLLAVAAFVCGVLVGHPFVGVVAAVALAGWLVLGSSRLQLDPSSVQPLESTAVDPEAAEHAAAFEALAFEQAGALSFVPAPGKTVIETLLIGPEGDRYAVVTDLVLNVVSSFGGRILVTRNSALATVPPDVLGNDLRGATPAELAAAHERALEILAARGLTPDRIRPEHLVEAHVAFERRCIEWATAGAGRRVVQSFFSSGLGAGALDETSASGRRIDAWLAAPAAAV
jgi:hypothetical protein